VEAIDERNKTIKIIMEVELDSYFNPHRCEGTKV
jgi:hypothetical protein